MLKKYLSLPKIAFVCALATGLTFASCESDKTITEEDAAPVQDETMNNTNNAGTDTSISNDTLNSRIDNTGTSGSGINGGNPNGSGSSNTNRNQVVPKETINQPNPPQHPNAERGEKVYGTRDRNQYPSGRTGGQFADPIKAWEDTSKTK